MNIVDMALHPAADNASGVIELWIADGQAASAQALIEGLRLPVATS